MHTEIKKVTYVSRRIKLVNSIKYLSCFGTTQLSGTLHALRVQEFYSDNILGMGEVYFLSLVRYKLYNIQKNDGEIVLQYVILTLHFLFDRWLILMTF